MEDVKKTGTTTVGLVFGGNDRGVVLGSEKKATMGYLVDSIKARKIYSVDEKIGITTAGNVGDIQTIVKYLKAEANIYRMQRNKRISVRALTSLLANILQGSKYFPYLGQFVIGGYDENGPQIFSLDPFGGVVEGDDYYSTGSGSPIAFGVLEDQYRKEIKRNDAIKLVIKAITAATRRDIASGGEVAIAVIDQNGYRELSEQELKSL